MVAPAVRVEMLDPRIIRWPDKRVRSAYSWEESDSLRASIQGHGQDRPLVVYELPDGSYEGADGQNRCEESVRLGLAEVLCIVRSGDNVAVTRSNLAGLNQGKPDPVSVADTIAHAYHAQGFSVPEIMTITGHKKEYVQECLDLAGATPGVRNRLKEGSIKWGHAALLARLDRNIQDAWLSSTISQGWTVAALATRLREVTPAEGAEVEAPRRPELDPPSASNTKRLHVRRPGRPPGPRRKPVCVHCAREYLPQEVQTVHVCLGCGERYKVNGDPGTAGIVPVPVDTLREAANALANSPATVHLAEQLDRLMEGGYDAGA